MKSTFQEFSCKKIILKTIFLHFFFYFQISVFWAALWGTTLSHRRASSSSIWRKADLQRRKRPSIEKNFGGCQKISWLLVGSSMKNLCSASTPWWIDWSRSKWTITLSLPPYSKLSITNRLPHEKKNSGKKSSDNFFLT